jgi:hypothetical protein
MVHGSWFMVHGSWFMVHKASSPAILCFVFFQLFNHSTIQPLNYLTIQPLNYLTNQLTTRVRDWSGYRPVAKACAV